MPNPIQNQEDSEAPSFKDKFKLRLRTLKPFSVVAKTVIASTVSLSLFFGLGYFAIATNYKGSIDIQIPNASLRIQNQAQNK